MKRNKDKRNVYIRGRVMMRLVGFMIAVALSVTSGFMLHANAMQRDQPQGLEAAPNNTTIFTKSAPSQKLSVEPGDTLWSIAKQYGGENVKQYMHEIRTANHLRSANLQVGQVLILP